MEKLNLIKKPDDRIWVSGRVYDIDMRLITVMRFIYLLADTRVEPYLKVDQGLKLLIKTNLRDADINDKIEAFNALKEKVSGEGLYLKDRQGRLLKGENGQPIPAEQGERRTDYIEDFEYIYAGFIQAYQIDLYDKQDMDWRKFKALLKSLPKTTFYREVIEIRSLDTSELTGSNLKKAIEAKRAYELKGG